MSELITTYLQDHHAGSSGGVDLFERVAESHSDPAVRSAVARLATEVRADRAALDGIMQSVGASTSTLKDAVGHVAEKLGRLKPNERLTERSPLSDLLELEMLTMAVHAKGLLWTALLAARHPALDAAELQRLADRAEAQRRELDELRLAQASKLRAE